FFQAEDGIRDLIVTGVQTCALPICSRSDSLRAENTAIRPTSSGVTMGVNATASRHPGCGGHHLPGVERLLRSLEHAHVSGPLARSEERRVGKECGERWARYTEREMM